MDGLNAQRHDAPWARTTSTVEARPPARPSDDWLGEISDDDWDEPVGRRSEQRHDVGHDLTRPTDARRSALADDRSPPVRAGDADGGVERRRIVVGSVLAAVLVLAVAVGVLVARGGDETSATAVSGPVTTTPEQTEAGTSAAPTTTTPADTSSSPATTAPSDAETTPTTTPSTSDTSAFVLPEGTKLRLGEDADPEVTADLQRVLTSAGYDPGPIDGTYGPQTVAAVVAFQQANDLTADGVVGPATAAALNDVLAAG
jgi:hypothetical protein